MPNVRPYKAFLYGKKYRDQLDDLISPPYDVISTEAHEALAKKNPHNSVKLSLCDDATDEKRYEKLRDRLQEWKTDQVFETNEKPAFYLVEEAFEVEGEIRKRVGFVGLLEVSPFEKKEVYPHEFTLSGPKKDRFELLKTMEAELSQIFFCYRDPNLVLEGIYEKKKDTPPYLKTSKEIDVPRRLWLVEDESEIKAIQKALSKDAVLIADGHHRYETALKMSQDFAGAKTKYVQGYFTNLDSPGFGILPIHRLFNLPESMDRETFKKALSEKFEVTAFSGEISPEELEKIDGLRMFCAFPGETYILRKAKFSNTDAEVFSLQKEIFEGILNWDVTKLAKGAIQFEHTTEDFKKTLHKLPRGVGFFLPPTDLEVVMAVVEKGERMPQKSTFFFPKLANGLVNYELGSY